MNNKKKICLLVWGIAMVFALLILPFGLSVLPSDAAGSVQEETSDAAGEDAAGAEVRELVACGQFDKDNLTDSQIDYIMDTYQDDPMAMQELQRQSDGNKPAMISLYTDEKQIHNSRFSHGYRILNGIDISSWQADINWNKVKNDGIEFAFIRVAYRGYGTGALMPDETAIKNLEAARKAGIDVGVYVYSQAITTAEAVEEANYAVKFIQKYSLELPVVMDYEYAPGGRLEKAKLTDTQRTAICNTFCSTVESHNYTGMVYANKSMLQDELHASDIANHYPIWLAHYTDETNYTGTYTFWQYSASGHVDGIDGQVDMDFWYLKNPDTTVGLKKSDATANTITLSWKKVPGVYGYQIVRYDQSQGAYVYIGSVRGAANTTYTDKNLDVNTAYKYKVRAVYKRNNGNFCGPYSSEIMATPLTKQIKNVKLSDATDTSVTIKWEPREDVSGYNIGRYDSASGKWTRVKTIAGTSASSYTDTSVEPGMKYTYRVRAYYEEDGARDYYKYSDDVSIYTLPGKISGLTAVAVNSNAIALEWNYQENVDGYRLYIRDTKNSKWTPIANLSGAHNNTYKHSGLKPNTTYTYCVRACYKSKGELVLAPISDSLITYTGPKAVSGLNVTGCSDSSITLSWSKSSGASGYELYRYDSKKGGYVLVSRVENGTTYTVSGLKAVTAYQFYIKSYAEHNGTRYYGTGVTYYASTSPAKVATVLTYTIGNKTMLKWTTVSYADGYSIYRYDKNKKTYTWLADVSGINNRYYLTDTVSSSYSYHVLSYKTYNGRKYKSKVSAAAREGSGPLYAKVITTAVNMRTGAGTNYSRILYLSTGQTVKITGAVGSGTNLWYKITRIVGGKTYNGYVRSDYLKLQ